MHHTLRFYGRHQHAFLRLYISLARLTNIPLAGKLVRRIANVYARNGHSGYLLTTAQAEEIVDAANNIALGPCSCRQVFHNCDTPVMNEIVLGAGIEVFSHRAKDFQEISKEQAKEILRQAHKSRLTHSIMQCGHHFYAICNCCGCCCVPTRLRQKYGIGYALTKNRDIVPEFQKRQS